MKLEDRIKTFADLGEIILKALHGKRDEFSSSLNNLIISQEKYNAWFTPENVRMALKAIGDELTSENLKTWTDNYPALSEENDPSTVGIVMAGNIPLVGFHDFLSVLISGNRLIARTSSKDPELIVELSHILSTLNPLLGEFIIFTDGPLKDFETVIATGSNNSSRYFEYYFGKYPHIIRKNRNSIAVIEGDETTKELEELGTDIFSYFGLGCRNVSKVFLPSGYDISNLIRSWQRFSDIINHNKYANNYDYNKAFWMVNREKFTDAGYMLLKESRELSSPVSVLYYEFYDSEGILNKTIAHLSERIQCITGRKNVPFGKSQFPKLWDYADNIDTIDFLLKKNMSGIL